MAGGRAEINESRACVALNFRCAQIAFAAWVDVNDSTFFISCWVRKFYWPAKDNEILMELP
jgi:hypothetical protein